MNKLTLPIEIGKKYLRRDGIMIKFERIEVNNIGESMAYPKSRLGVSPTDWVYSNTGRYNLTNVIHDMDIISDCVEAAEEFKVGDIVKITQSDSEFYKEHSIARLSIKNENGRWWADFKDCGNIRGSYNDGHDGIWCIGTASPDKFIHTKPLDVEDKVVGHVHAANMLLYAQDAAETDKPWEQWEYQKWSGGLWYSFTEGSTPNWNLLRQYRRKLPEPKFININGFQVPEPLRVAPKKGTIVYMPCIDGWFGKTSSFRFDTHSAVLEAEMIANGLCHLTPEAAEIHATATLSFTKVE